MGKAVGVGIELGTTKSVITVVGGSQPGNVVDTGFTAIDGNE